MAKSNDLYDFVREALNEGHARPDISRTLSDAGWSPDEISGALDAWADTTFRPPVPRPRALVSARDFFLYTLLFGAMVFTAGHLVYLTHELIDLWFRTEGDYLGGSLSGIRWSLAVLLVSTPVFVLLTRRDLNSLAVEPGRRRSAIRKWMTYGALLIAAAVLLGDLVTTLFRLFSGEVTLQFLAKATVVAIVAGTAFVYYWRDVERSDAP